MKHEITIKIGRQKDINTKNDHETFFRKPKGSSKDDIRERDSVFVLDFFFLLKAHSNACGVKSKVNK